MPDTLIMQQPQPQPKNYPALLVFLVLVDTALLWANLLVWWPDPEPTTSDNPVQTEQPEWEGNLFTPTQEEEQVPQDYYRPEPGTNTEATPSERAQVQTDAPTTMSPDPSTEAPTPSPTPEPTPEPSSEPSETATPEPSQSEDF